ncbi:MAG: hypothetical protein A2Y76_11545 [Planctomycetes bacterium RBG_13_60_9]|nr:MAG: hypothetical protein A2Y76_11545 [Planctomycetes bacterium RBG_13_60_9]
MYRFNLGLCFEDVVRTHARNTALMFAKSHTVSYEQLNQCANQIGRYLLEIGVRRKDVVCISGDKHLYTYACMLACLKIGAIYAVADPDSPVERLAKIFSACRPRVLFIGSRLAERLHGGGDWHIVCSESSELREKIAPYDRGNVEMTRDVTGTNPAYIMYTSGSTGVPKGAVITHDNLLRFIEWSAEAFEITPEDVLTNVNPLYFDNSVFDFYTSLFSGACLVPLAKNVVADAKSLVDTVDQCKCTVWFSVPSLLVFLQIMKALRPDTMKSVRTIIFGGEGYPKSKLKRLYDLYSQRTSFFNVYGPTECTCICSCYKISRDDFVHLQGYPPLGSLIGNFSYLVLGEGDRQVPDDEVGELCLLGPSVGQGYYSDAERTKATFCLNPYNPQYEERMYRTGDLVKYNPEDGKLYILGRRDNQIKHMGYRIELEEIETALNSLDYVCEAAVVHGSSRGLSQIIAVVSVQDGRAANDVREDLRHILPGYMIPTAFHLVAELPKNANGKVNRNQLAKTYVAQDADMGQETPYGQDRDLWGRQDS